MPGTSHPEGQPLVISNNHKVRELRDRLLDKSNGSLTIKDDDFIQTLDDRVNQLVEEQSRKNLCNGWLIVHIINESCNKNKNKTL